MPTSRDTVAGLAAELMSGVSAELKPAAVTTPSETFITDSGPEPISTFRPVWASAEPPVSQATAGNQLVNTKAKHMSTSSYTMSHQTVPSTAQPTQESEPLVAAHSQAKPACSQPAALVCRRDLSFAALAVQASFSPSASDPAAASPPTTEAQTAQPAAKRQKRVFLHGNYNRYYGYRLGAELEEDPRVQVTHQPVGCNSSAQLYCLYFHCTAAPQLHT